MPDEEEKKMINVALTVEAHRKLTILCAAWIVTQGEALSRLLESYDVRPAVERQQ